MNFIDIHCHILPGIDDGPRNMEAAGEMLRRAADDGVTHIFATPHIMDGVYDNKTRNILDALNELKLRTSGAIKLFHGADVRLTPRMMRGIEGGDIPTLNDTGYLLLELPLFVLPPNMDSLIFNLRQRNVVPIITHPERHMRLANDLPSMSKLRDYGAMFQVTAMSITGDFGKAIRKSVLAMIEEGLADIVASDAHNAWDRPPVLSSAYREVKNRFGTGIADRMFFHTPNKILETKVNQ